MGSVYEVADLISKAVFGDYTTVLFGDSEEKRRAYHKSVMYGVSIDPEISYIIPDHFYNPRLTVAFDFTSQFTAAGFGSKRPVPYEAMERVGSELSRYFRYYFEYVMTYGDTTKRSEIAKLADRGLNFDEGELNLFINWMINMFLQGVGTESSIGQVGTASIEINDATSFKHNQRSKLFFDHTFSILNQLFVPMVPCMIWAKGRLYKDWYFPIFDGRITSVEPSNRGGFTSLSINCRDVLELARFSTEMVNPSLMQVEEIVKQSFINIYSEPFYKVNHFDAFNAMFRGGKITYEAQRRFLEISDDNRNISGSVFSALGEFERVDDTKPDYRTPEVLEHNEGAIHKHDFSLLSVLKKTSHERKRCTVSWGNNITPFSIFNISSPQPYVAEFSSRLEILNHIAQLTYYDLYVDGYGSVHYNPMRLANKFLKYSVFSNNKWHVYQFPGTQIVGPHELLNESNRVNIEELTTFLRVTGKNPYVSNEIVTQAMMSGSAVDRNLMSRFGYRRKSIDNPLFNYNVTLSTTGGKTIKFMDAVAYSLLKYMNSELYSTQMNMVFRPELKIGAPIYQPYSKDIFYCQSMTHSVSVNGDASTMASGNFGRKEKEPPPNLFDFLVMSEKMKNSYSSRDNKQLVFSNAEEMQEYYESEYGVTNPQFATWLDSVSEQNAKFEQHEKELNTERT